MNSKSLSVLSFLLFFAIFYGEDAVAQVKFDAAESESRKAWLAAHNEDFERYYQKVREKIELVVASRFPEKEDKALYGALTVEIPIYQDGSIYDVDGGPRVEHGSGNSFLDQAGLDLIRAAAPFEPFPDHLRTKGKKDVWIMKVVLSFENKGMSENRRNSGR